MEYESTVAVLITYRWVSTPKTAGAAVVPSIAVPVADPTGSGTSPPNHSAIEDGGLDGIGFAFG